MPETQRVLEDAEVLVRVFVGQFFGYKVTYGKREMDEDRKKAIVEFQMPSCQNLNFSRPIRFQDLYIGANRLLARYIYSLGFKGLFQPQREVQTYCLTSTQCLFAVNIELLHIKTRSYVVCLSPNIYAKCIIV